MNCPNPRCKGTCWGSVGWVEEPVAPNLLDRLLGRTRSRRIGKAYICYECSTEFAWTTHGLVVPIKPAYQLPVQKSVGDGYQKRVLPTDEEEQMVRGALLDPDVRARPDIPGE